MLRIFDGKAAAGLRQHAKITISPLRTGRGKAATSREPIDHLLAKQGNFESLQVGRSYQNYHKQTGTGAGKVPQVARGYFPSSPWSSPSQYLFRSDNVGSSFAQAGARLNRQSQSSEWVTNINRRYFSKLRSRHRQVKSNNGSQGSSNGSNSNSNSSSSNSSSSNSSSSNSSNNNSSNSSKAQPLSLTGRLRKLSREYGWVAFGIYLGLSVLDFPFCFLAVRAVGTDKIGEIEHWIVSKVEVIIPTWVKEKWEASRNAFRTLEKNTTGDDIISEGAEMVGWGVDEASKKNKIDASLATQLALAYAIHKSFIFIRIPLTVAITPKVVKVLRGWGWQIGKRSKKTKGRRWRNMASKRRQ